MCIRDRTKSEDALTSKIEILASEYKNHMTSTDFSKAISKVIEIVSLVNKYIDSQEPWALAKNSETDRLSTVLRISLESIRILSFLIYPICPLSSLKILQSLGLDEKILALDSDTLTNFSFLKEDLIITKVDLLFPKIDKKIS